MLRFFKNIFNAVILVLVFVGLNSLYNNHFFDNMFENVVNFFQQNTDATINKVGDFSDINSEFNIDTAVNLFGYKTVIIEHLASNQRFIILDSGRKTLLSDEDIKGSGIEEKLTDLSEKFKYQSSKVSDIKITDKGYFYAYGKRLPYVRFTASVTKLPVKNISALVSVNNYDKQNQRILISVNDKKRYSQLITNEFYRAVREARVEEDD